MIAEMAESLLNVPGAGATRVRMKYFVFLLLAIQLVACDQPASNHGASLDETGEALLVELQATVEQDNPTIPTPLWEDLKDDDDYWQSEEGSALYRKVLLEQHGHPNVRLNFLHWQGPKVKGLQDIIEEGMMVHVTEERVRYVFADLYQYVSEDERRLPFMLYMAIHDPDEGVRRNLFYHLPTSQLTDENRDTLYEIVQDEDEWYPARIGAAWSLSASGDERGTQWAIEQKKKSDTSEYEQLLDQVVKPRV